MVCLRVLCLCGVCGGVLCVHCVCVVWIVCVYRVCLCGVVVGFEKYLCVL